MRRKSVGENVHEITRMKFQATFDPNEITEENSDRREKEKNVAHSSGQATNWRQRSKTLNRLKTSIRKRFKMAD